MTSKLTDVFSLDVCHGDEADALFMVHVVDAYDVRVNESTSIPALAFEKRYPSVGVSPRIIRREHFDDDLLFELLVVDQPDFTHSSLTERTD
jgi:hypothetical protein